MPLELASQVEETTSSCINVRQLNVPFGQPQTLATENGEMPEFNRVYYQDQDEFTFWYKLIITENCVLKFSVSPTVEDDEYDFLLYEFQSKNFCEALVDNDIEPVNVNTYHSEEILTDKDQEIQVQSSFQHPISVRKGEVYYISVMNVGGEDCGHKLRLEACGSAQVVNSVNKPCFQFEKPKKPKVEEPDTELASEGSTAPDRKDTVASPPVKEEEEELIIVEDYLIVTGFIRDNDNGKPINGTISFEDKINGRKFEAEATAESGYRIEVERGRSYRLVCNSFGYYDVSGSIEFYKPATYDFYLLKVKAGDHFVVDNIYFHPNTYVFMDRAYPGLDKLLYYMKENKSLKVEIQGHTAGNNDVTSVKPEYIGKGEAWEFVGSAKKLSKLRAEAVVQYLVKNGIEESRLRSKGYGADRLLVANPKSDGERRKNMRVEVLILSSSDSFYDSLRKGPDSSSD